MGGFLFLFILNSSPPKQNLINIYQYLIEHKGGEKIRTQTIIIILTCILSILLCSTVSATVVPNNDNVYVSTTGNDTSGNGSESNPYQTIKKGIDTVNGNGSGVVYLAPGIYKGINNKQMDISKSFTLQGSGKENTIIDAENSGNMIDIYSGVVVIKDLTIRNGHESGYGGAIGNADNLTLINCNFENNQADLGGAICNVGTLELVNCSFSNNSARRGGAIYNGKIDLFPGYMGSLTISNCTFQNNTAQVSGAIENWGSLTITDSIFTSNNAIAPESSAIGGALYNGNTGTTTIVRSFFSKNTAQGVVSSGGAIGNDGILNITSSVFYQNYALLGGAIFQNGAGCAVHFSRFIENTAVIGNAIYNINYNSNLTENWWGSNNPIWENLIKIGSASVDHSTWLYMTINATPSTINNTQTSLITVSFNHLFNGTNITPLDPNTGHIPDETPVTFNTDLGSIGCKTIDKETSGGIATATLTADETQGTAHVNAVCDNQTLYTNVTIDPTSGLYLKITSNKTNPVVGDTVLYTLKVGNKGPDTAKDVVMTYVIPKGLEFAGANVDVGNYTYDPDTRTITWIIGDVPVGDPVMYLSLRISSAGQYALNPSLSTSTNDPTLNTNTQSISINIAQNNTTDVNASSTVTMQHTGIPLNYLIMGILMVICGLIIPKRK